MATTVDTLLVRIEADMQDLKKGLASVQQQTEQTTSKMSSAFRKVGAALAAVGGAAVMGNLVKSSIKTGMSLQGLRIQLNALLGSVEEGGKAFKLMTQFANGVPFSLDAIQAGSGSLAAAAKSADELGELMQITGNIAALFKIPFDVAAENVQRAMSAGAASADLFQQKGVNAFMGLQAGVSYSAGETAKVLQKHFGRGGTSDGAMAEFALTSEGIASMFGDAMHRMRTAFAESGLNAAFDKITAALTNLINEFTPFMVILGNVANATASVIAPAINVLANNLELLGYILAGVIARFVVLRTVMLAAMAVQMASAFAATSIAAWGAVGALTGVQKAIIVMISAAKSLTGALVILRGVLITVLPIAIFAGIAWVIAKFLELKKRAGSFGEAMKVLKDVFISAWDVMKAGIGVFGAVFTSIFKGVKADFLEFLADIQKRMSDFLLKLSNVIRKIPNMSGTAADLIGAGTEALEAHNELDRAASNLRRGAGEDIKKAMDEGKLATTKLSNAWQYLKSLLKDTEGEEAQEANLNKVKLAASALADAITEKVNPVVEAFRNGIDQMATDISTALADAVANGKMNLESLRDAFSQTLRQMLADAMKAQIIKPMISGMFSAVGGAIGGDAGTFISSIGQTKSATGGPVMRGAPVLVGERGPELFVPQGAGSIVNAATTRGMGGGVTVNQTFAFSANGDESVKKLIHQAAPQIAKMTEQGIMGSRRRGGQMKAVFG